LREDLRATHERGYSVTRGENVPDVMAVAAPLRGYGSLLGVALAGPMHRMHSKESALARRLLNCVRRLELRHEA
jgi:IclR family transcriptional regulator, acetate operon repressor